MAKNEAERVMDELEPICGEPIEYLFAIIEQTARQPLTKERKAQLQAPKTSHRMSWIDEAWAEVEEAIELGEL